MNKTQTKIDAERYVAPAMNEHVLMMKRHILDGSMEGSLGSDATFGEESEF